MLGCEQAIRLTSDMGPRARTSALLAVARPLIVFSVIGATLFFLGWTLVSNWDSLQSEELHVRPVLLAVSLVPGLAGVLVLALTWPVIVRHMSGSGGDYSTALVKTFLYSWAGRYIPGKVAYVVGRFFLGRSLGVSSQALVGSIVYESALLLVAGAALATVTLVPTLAVESESVLPYLALPVLVVGGAVALHPTVLRRLLRFGTRIAGRDAGELDWLLPSRLVGGATMLYALAFVLNGLGFYLLIVSITDYSVRYLPLAVGVYGLAAVLGMISVFAPAGLGVREGVIVAVLQTTMPVELAVAISIAARFWATAIDLLLIGGCFVYDQLSGERMLINAIRGRGETVAAAPVIDT